MKALCASTNTWIKTPARGEKPVFSITGQPNHVQSAKWEIVAAADYFRDSLPPSANSNSPHGRIAEVTISVRVPYRVVGQVVGPGGATIKRIQQLTHTFIVTPSRHKEPCFMVTGVPENVEWARVEIRVLRGSPQTIDQLAQQMQPNAK